MKRLAMAGLGLALAALAAAQRPVPDEPSERFAVLVHTSVSGDEDPDAKFPMAEVVEEVAKRIEDRDEWFVLTEDPDVAEVLVDVVSHTVNERMRTRMETRVDVTGTRKEWVDVQWVQEQHFLEARVNLPAGPQAIVKGSDTRQKGGTLKRASEELAANLELVVRERYWDLEPAR